MRRAPAGDQLDPHQRLLTRLHQVGAPAVEFDRVAADLADRFGGPGEEFGVVPDEVMGSAAAAVLFVGEECDDQVALWLSPGAQDVADGGDDHGIHVLHVDRAAPPQHAVFDDPAERVDGPVARIRGNYIEMAVDDECGLGAVPAFDSGDDAGAPGVGVERLRAEADRLEPGGDVLGRVALAVRAALAVVRRVESDQVAGDDRRFVECRIVRGARHPPTLPGAKRGPPVRRTGVDFRAKVLRRRLIRQRLIHLSGWRKWQTR